MTMEQKKEVKKTTCPHCGSKNCFEEEMKETIFAWLCCGCGYTTNSFFKEGSEMVLDAEKSTAQIVVELKFVDPNTNLAWYPSVIQVKDKGMVFPEGTKSDWKWAFAPIIEINDEERKKYPIPGSENDYYQTRLAVEHAERYEMSDFIGALKRIGIVYDTEPDTKN